MRRREEVLAATVNSSRICWSIMVFISVCGLPPPSFPFYNYNKKTRQKLMKFSTPGCGLCYESRGSGVDAAPKAFPKNHVLNIMSLNKRPHHRPHYRIPDPEQPPLRPVQVHIGRLRSENSQGMKRVVRGPFAREGLDGAVPDQALRMRRTH